MSRPRSRTHRPVLLILVYGVFLDLLGITARSYLISLAHLGAADVVGALGIAAVKTFLNASGRPERSRPDGRPDRGGPSSNRPASCHLTRPDGTRPRRAPLFRRGGSSPRATRRPRRRRPRSPIRARGCRDSAGVLTSASSTAAADLAATTPTVLEEYLPVSTDGRVRAVVAIWRDAAPILASLAELRRDVVLITLTAGIVAAVILFFVFRAAQGRLTRQAAALVESTRLDPLTGLLNHGALVGLLADGLEAARASESPLGIALLDIDNFPPPQRQPWPPGRRRGAPDGRRPPPPRVALDDHVRALRTRRVPPHRPGCRDRAARADDRPGPDRARRSEPPIRGDRTAADHRERRRVHVPEHGARSPSSPPPRPGR